MNERALHLLELAHRGEEIIDDDARDDFASREDQVIFIDNLGGDADAARQRARVEDDESVFAVAAVERAVSEVASEHELLFVRSADACLRAVEMDGCAKRWHGAEARDEDAPVRQDAHAFRLVEAEAEVRGHASPVAEVEVRRAVCVEAREEKIGAKSRSSDGDDVAVGRVGHVGDLLDVEATCVGQVVRKRDAIYAEIRVERAEPAVVRKDGDYVL